MKRPFLCAVAFLTAVSCMPNAFAAPQKKWVHSAFKFIFWEHLAPTDGRRL